MDRSPASLVSRSLLRGGGISRALIAVLTCCLLLAGQFSTALAAPAQQDQPSHTTATACPQPPQGVDLTTLADTQLASYGLPRRPKPGDKEGLALWRHELQGARHRYCVPSVGSDRTTLPPRSSHVSASNATSIIPESGSYDRDNINWAGVELATTNTFNFTEGEWHIPCYVAANSPSLSTASQWVGLGGDPGNLLQAGTETDPRYGYSFWYELYTGSTSHIQTIQLPTGDGPYCGDDVVFEVGYNWVYVNQSSVFAEDWSRGWYTVYELNFVPNFGTAEWINERLGIFVNGSQTACITQLADFNETDWINSLAASAGVNGDNKMPISTFENASAYALYYQNMYDTYHSNDRYLAESDALHSDGKSFIVTWFDNGLNEGC